MNNQARSGTIGSNQVQSVALSPISLLAKEEHLNLDLNLNLTLNLNL